MRTTPPFDERALGFANFRRFLERAAAENHVRVVPAAKGPDVDVLPTSVRDRTESSGDHHERIEASLWNAFVRWPDESRRFWSKSLERVELLCEQDARDRAPTPDLVPIEPIGQEKVLQCMAAFAASLDEPRRARLRQALASDKPFRDFVAAATETDAIRAWREYLRKYVELAIRSWAQANNLEVRTTGRRAQRVAPSEVGGRTGYDLREEALRTRIQRYIERMTLPELLTLSIPLRLTLD